MTARPKHTSVPPEAAAGPAASAYVTRELCERIHAEQRDANRRTWDELRTLRRLVITVVLGGQLLAAGLNVAGLAWWLDQHTAQTHPATARSIETVRAEARQDVREVRGELRAALAAILGRLDGEARPRMHEPSDMKEKNDES